MAETRYLGDSAALTLALTHPDTGAAFSPAGHVLLFTLKRDALETDLSAIVQKSSVTGGITLTNPAVVALVPADWTNIKPGLEYVADIQAQNATTGAVLTVWSGALLAKADVTRLTTLSIPTTTTNPALGYTWANIPDAPANLVALGALAENGMLARTGAGTVAARTITGTAGQIAVANGDGVAGNPTLSLASALEGINSITSVAGQPLILATGTSGPALTIASATNLATFAAAVTVTGIVQAARFGNNGTSNSGVGFYGTFQSANTNGLQFSDSAIIPAANTTAYTSFDSIPGTAAAVFSVANVYHFHARDQGLGAGSTVTTQTGLNVGALSMGTTIYGIRSQVASGPNKYNLYVDGTAQNLISGALTLGGNLTLTGANPTIASLSSQPLILTPSSFLVQVNQPGGGNVVDVYNTGSVATRLSSNSASYFNGGVLLRGGTNATGVSGFKEFSTEASTSTTTGSIINAGGFGNAGKIFAGDTITAQAPVASTLALVSDNTSSSVSAFAALVLRQNGSQLLSIFAGGNGNTVTHRLNGTVDLLTMTPGATPSLANAVVATAGTMEASGLGTASFVMSGGLSVAKDQRNGGSIYQTKTAGDLEHQLTTTTSGAAKMVLSGYGSQTGASSTANTTSFLTLQNKDTTANVFTGIEGIDQSANTIARILFVQINDANNEGRMAFLTRPSGGLLTEVGRWESNGTFNVLSATEATTGGAGAVTIAGGIYAAMKVITASSITTGAPAGGTAAAWKFGTVAVVSPTSPDRTIELDVAGTRYFLAAKTTND